MSVRITDYSERHFGNHIANVTTDDGNIRVIFDKKYEVELLESAIPIRRSFKLQRMLDEEWQRDARTELGHNGQQ